MMIATILLIANLLALVFAEPFMSFAWNAWAYLIEIGVYVAITLIFFIIAAIASR